MRILRCHFRWVLGKQIAVAIYALVSASGLGFAQERDAQSGEAAITPQRSAETDSGARGKTSEAPPPRLFDLMISEYDRQQVGWYDKYSEIFRSGALGGDGAGTRMCLAHATHECGQAIAVLQSMSPTSDAYDERKAAGDLRQRFLVYEMASSTDHSLETGDFDRVGKYALVREEPHSEFKFKGPRVDGKDMDILKVYVYLDRVCKGGDLVADVVPRMAYDVGSYLFANAEYFLNTADPNKVKKATDQAIKDAARSLADAIADRLESGKAPYALASHRAQFEECKK